ncbi:recombinase family protein [Deinococcus sp. Leaf326]|uniref:recombinase family protein n=1 Tax=Deinococcus sp. Leaf326 TaxID=1736338 RepID=UPI0006F602B2|nr:recombinase family protein [Deinococcus sp. Leaf326]KQR22919.1 hypothetical protein ASF71_07055 [Deinococcus sp. Leaf326]
MTVRLYVRVSTQQQATDGFSIAAQRSKGEAWAAYQGHTDVEVYTDAGISGKRDDRPSLTALLADLRPGDIVVSYALSRLARGGAVQLLGIVNDIRERGARVVFLQENLDTDTSTGRLMLTILAALAELEVEQTRERTEMGRTQAAREGIWPHSDQSLPFGWMRGEDGRIIENPAGAETVRLIFAQGSAPYNQTAALLNSLGLSGRRGKLTWKATQVRDVVLYQGYATGEVRYRQDARPDSPEDHLSIPAPALVTPDVWAAAQRDRTVNHPHSQPGLYPLTGHVRCSCGARLFGKIKERPSGESAIWYVCYEAARRTPACPTNGRNTRLYPARPLHQQARDLLAHLLRHPNDPAHTAIAYGSVPITDPHTAERAEIQVKLDRLLDAYLSGLIEKPTYEQRQRSLSGLLQGLRPPARQNLTAQPAREDLAALVLACPNEELAAVLDDLQVEFVVRDGALALLHYAPL